MAAGELSIALTVLRVIRGWNQHDLARASGIHNSSVSEYERGRTVPELRSLERMVAAMGFPLSALEQTRTFIESVRLHSVLTEAVAPGSERPSSGSSQGPSFSREQLADNPAALRWELEQVSVEAGRVFSRMSRVMFALMDRAVRSDLPP